MSKTHSEWKLDRFGFAFISFLLLRLSTEIPMMLTSNFQYIDLALDFRNAISGFPLLHRQHVAIDLERQKFMRLF